MDQDYYYLTYPSAIWGTLIFAGVVFSIYYLLGDYILEGTKRTFIYFFVPKKICIDGVIIKFIDTKIPLSSNPDDDFALHLCSICVWSPMNNKCHIFEGVPYYVYEKLEKKKSSLDMQVTVPCNTYGYTGNKLFPKWN